MLNFIQKLKRIEGDQMQILSIQVALFFKELEHRPDKYIMDIENYFNGLFDNMPTILPVPPEVPPEVPVVILSSSKSSIKINISRSRMDLFVEPREDLEISEALDASRKVIDEFLNFGKTKLNVVRIGVITNIFIREKSPLERLQNKYFHAKVENLSEISVRFNQETKVNKLKINNVYDVKLAELTIQGIENPRRGILLKVDINNQPSSNNELINSRLDDLVQYVFGKLREERIKEVI